MSDLGQIKLIGSGELGFFQNDDVLNLSYQLAALEAAAGMGIGGLLNRLPRTVNRRLVAGAGGSMEATIMIRAATMTLATSSVRAMEPSMRL